jgi:hypothetical protein
MIVSSRSRTQMGWHPACLLVLVVAKLDPLIGSGGKHIPVGSRLKYAAVSRPSQTPCHRFESARALPYIPCMNEFLDVSL